MKTSQIVLFGLIYTIGYFLLAVGCAGGGHGTLIFVAPLITWILLFPTLFLLTRLNKGLINHFFFVLLMLLHYAHILFFLSPLFSLEFDPNTVKAWDTAPVLIVITAVWYLAGQLIIWLVFFKSFKNQETLK